MSALGCHHNRCLMLPTHDHATIPEREEGCPAACGATGPPSLATPGPPRAPKGAASSIVGTARARILLRVAVRAVRTCPCENRSRLQQTRHLMDRRHGHSSNAAAARIWQQMWVSSALGGRLLGDDVMPLPQRTVAGGRVGEGGAAGGKGGGGGAGDTGRRSQGLAIPRRGADRCVRQKGR